MLKKKKEFVNEEVKEEVVSLEKYNSDTTVLKKEISNLLIDLKKASDKITVLSEEVVSKDEQIRAYESIEQNNETVFSKSGILVNFVKNIAILNKDNIIQVSKVVEGKLKKEVIIKTTYGDLLMECEISQAEEFDKEYKRILNSI